MKKNVSAVGLLSRNWMTTVRIFLLSGRLHVYILCVSAARTRMQRRMWSAAEAGWLPSSIYCCHLLADVLITRTLPVKLICLQWIGCQDTSQFAPKTLRH